MSNELLIETDGTIDTLTLNRADKLNALNAALLGELGRAFASIAAAPPRAVIVTGAGKAFSAGVDIGEMSGMSTIEAKRRADQGHALADLVETLSCPVI